MHIYPELLSNMYFLLLIMVKKRWGQLHRMNPIHLVGIATHKSLAG